MEGGGGGAEGPYTNVQNCMYECAYTKQTSLSTDAAALRVQPRACLDVLWGTSTIAHHRQHLLMYYVGHSVWNHLLMRPKGAAAP